ncbi:D-allose transporter subunit [Clostridium ragsdalei P11]|uniref:D-allose transporter subunit n=1 Tax=Clostridium ragsdalei P11 TaxID=1353534 RepID=A0A1A6AS31_9CLOT|nr:ABC transporter permease [Clostridium ragsdalei]OBR92886.1 D-allose transporter subunit [Clostridium ragsdalei P11]
MINVLKGWKLKKTDSCSMMKKVMVSIISVIGGIVFSAIIIAITGNDPIDVCSQIFSGAFGSTYGLSETVAKSIPLMLTSLGVSLAFRMQLWNIGAEGQFFMGAFGASWAALSFPNMPAYELLPLMMIAGFIAGGLWSMVAAIPKAFLNINETITTLLLNYIAILWVQYLVFGPWKDPKGKNFPVSATFSKSATLTSFGNTDINIGLFIGIGIAVLMFIVLKYSRWGYEIRVSGGNKSTAIYAGMNYVRNILIVMFISGGIAGIAGMVEVSGVIHKLQQNISPGYGYTAVIIALLARLSPLGIVIVSFFMGGLFVGGYNLQTSGFSLSMVLMFQGAILLFVLGSEILLKYKLVRKEA